MVIKAARQDAGAVGDVAHRGGPQTAFGEHRRRQLKQFVAPVHGCWLDTEITSPVR